MIFLAAVLLPLVIGSHLMFARLYPRHAPSEQLRRFNRWAWLVAAVGVLVSVLVTWLGSVGSTDYAWWPVAAAFVASLVWVGVLLAATTVRYFVFRRQRA
jgi:membrane protein YdbS with pleckstrin-like domain